MRCDTAQRAVSTSMDERSSIPANAAAHVTGCSRCTTFRDGAWRLRELSRFEVAPAVPDLVPSIMAAVRAEAAAALPAGRSAPARRRFHRPPLRRRELAAVLAGFVIGLVVTAGGIIPRRAEDTAALAAQIPEELIRAAVALDGYRATFEITELNWTVEVPRRTFVAELAFAAPESFRVQVRDTTRYPSAGWPRNDLLLETDGRTWRVEGPDPCPAAALPACPRLEPVTRAVVNRAPFDARTAMPTDVIVPMTVLAAADRVDVVGYDAVDGRPAVSVAMSHQDAQPLSRYLTFLGSWRPFYPQDRVVVWLDRDTWFPLRYEVTPASGPERALWAAQMSLPLEAPADPVFTAEVRSFATARPGLVPVGAPASAVDAGFVEAGEGADVSMLTPSVPTDGLELRRAGSFATDETRAYRESIAAYTNGLSWLTVTRLEGWDQASLYGVGSFAEQVALPGNEEVGYYEPASGLQPRRLALHTEDGEFLVATNLPRATLMGVAASLPVAGEIPPQDWSVRTWAGGTVVTGLSPDEAIARAAFDVLMPTEWPSGYEPAAAEHFRSDVGEGVTIVFRRPNAELDGVGLRLYQATGQTLAPPSDPAQQVVSVGGPVGRWSPQEHLLEWMDGEVYRSLSGPAFDLSTLVGLARSLGPGEGSTG